MSSTPVRSLYEYALLSFLLDHHSPYLARRPDYLVVGYCYGMQAMNVALGGTLWQSIPVELYRQQYVEDVIAAGPENMHRNYHLAVYPTPVELYRGWFHPLKTVTESPWIKNEPGVYVLSNHQQAVRELGQNLRILATSQDGKVAEVMQHTRFPNVLAVQGHPERRFAWNRLGTFPPATRRFHEGFFAQVRKVLEASRKARRSRVAQKR
jgi:putative glutamine amidotransferase